MRRGGGWRWLGRGITSCFGEYGSGWCISSRASANCTDSASGGRPWSSGLSELVGGHNIDPSLKHSIMLFFSFCRTVPEEFQATCKLNTCINFDCIATPNPSLHTHPGIAQDYDGYRDGGGGSSRCDCEGEENQRQSTPKVCDARVESSWHTTSIPLSNRRICFYGSV